MAIDYSSYLPPELELQKQQLNRQQEMAKALLAQGQQMAQGPAGQMVSGQYVANSPWQMLNAPIAQIVGAYLGTKGDEKSAKLATALRDREMSDIQKYTDLMKGREATPEVRTELAGPYGANMGEDGSMNIPQPEAVIPSREAVAANPEQANVFATSSYSPILRQMGLKKLTEGPIKVGLEDSLIDPVTMKPVFTGAGKPRAPLQIDTGTAIELRDPANPMVVLQRIPKTQMPTAGQIYESSEGPLLVNTKAGTATPLMGSDGKPLAPKLSSEQSKDITAINQQRSTINGAIADVNKNKSAFSFGRGLAQNAPYGESIAGRFEKPEDTQTRAYVYNNVSSVIKERAGTAQSAQELQRINSFLPATTDNADQIVAKLKGFNKYLDDLEKGTRLPVNKKPDAQQSNVFSSEADAQKAIQNGTLKKGDKITVNGVTGTIQ